MQPMEIADSRATSTSSTSSGNSRFYHLSYYKPYFDITTESFISRLQSVTFPWKYTLLPVNDNLNDSSSSYVASTSTIDLYGPFWITTTLILLAAIASNLASFLVFEPEYSDEGKAITSWQYDFMPLSVAATIFYVYLFILPIGFYFALNHDAFQQSFPISFVEVVCVFGYGLFPLLFSFGLCVIPSGIFRWIIIFLCGAWQSYFICKNLWKDRTNRKVFTVFFAIIGVNCALALITIFYFF
jgi:hypothetical protein